MTGAGAAQQYVGEPGGSAGHGHAGPNDRVRPAQPFIESAPRMGNDPAFAQRAWWRRSPLLLGRISDLHDFQGQLIDPTVEPRYLLHARDAHHFLDFPVLWSKSHSEIFRQLQALA